MKGLRKLFRDGGGADRVSLRYWSAEVEASWSIDIEGPESLQIVYERQNQPETFSPALDGPVKTPDERFWLYLHPSDAAVIGAILTAYAAAHGETA